MFVMNFPLLQYFWCERREGSAILCICVSSSEPSQLAEAINTKICVLPQFDDLLLIFFHYCNSFLHGLPQVLFMKEVISSGWIFNGHFWLNFRGFKRCTYFFIVQTSRTEMVL